MNTRRIEVTVETEEVVRRTRRRDSSPETPGPPARRWLPAWLRRCLSARPVSVPDLPHDPPSP